MIMDSYIAFASCNTLTLLNEKTKQDEIVLGLASAHSD